MEIFQVLLIIIGVIILYLIIEFLLSQLFIKELGRKGPLQRFENTELIEKLDDLSKRGSKHEILADALDMQLARFYSRMGQVYRKFGFLFIHDVNSLWNKKGFLHCHQQCLMLRTILINTGRFSEDDIKYRITYCYANIHEYLFVNISNTQQKDWIKVDPYAMSLGFNLGEVLPHLAYLELKRRGLDSKNRKYPQ